jgi:NADH-quinone oxidoreductase subunit M
MSIVGMYQAHPISGVFVALGVVLGATYMLNLYRGVMLGVADETKTAMFSDLKSYEICALLPLVFMIIYFGIQPNYWLSIINLPINEIVNLYNA